MGICPSVTKRYEGVGGGVRQRYVMPFFFIANGLVYRHVLASDADFTIIWLP